MAVSEVPRTDAGARNVRAENTHARSGPAPVDARARVGTRACREGGADRAGVAGAPASTVAAGRAARDLGLRRAEFEIAVHLGLIRVATAPDGGRPRVPEEEIARLGRVPGFPGSMVERVRTVGTAEGAALLGIAPARFTRLARAGCFCPVTFYLNRYRAVVWLYLADELRAFAAREPELLGGRAPVEMRALLESGVDWRPRNWRSQRIDRLVSRSRDPWVRAAVQASALDPVQLAEVVDDPYERAYLVRVRPEPVFGRPASPAAREAMAELLSADDPDEILWRRVNLTLELDRAREERPAPVPGGDTAVRAMSVRGATGRVSGVGGRAGAVGDVGGAVAAAAGAGAAVGAGKTAPAPVAVPVPPPATVCVEASRAAVPCSPDGALGPAEGAPSPPRGRGFLARLGWRGRGAG
ncbi:DUF6397 family protein [Streptomyces californicus]|uniref:DUF6397 family protein n=1 Tax=Streptomyces californicus TaxID=67351 RepID=UPI00379B9D1C